MCVGMIFIRQPECLLAFAPHYMTVPVISFIRCFELWIQRYTTPILHSSRHLPYVCWHDIYQTTWVLVGIVPPAPSTSYMSSMCVLPSDMSAILFVNELIGPLPLQIVQSWYNRSLHWLNHHPLDLLVAELTLLPGAPATWCPSSDMATLRLPGSSTRNSVGGSDTSWRPWSWCS